MDNFGTQLASIHNAEENNAALNMRIATLYTWIGGTDADEEGTWIWLDNSSFNFTDWGVAGTVQPDNKNGNQNCAAIFASTATAYDPNKWDDATCTANLNQFICNNPKYTSCSDWMYNFRSIKQLSKGVYYIYDETLGVINVYCVFDYDNNYGWTLIQSASRSYLNTTDFEGKAFVDDVSYNIGMYLIALFITQFC